MPEMSWEHTAEARAALTAIVSDPEYGEAALSSPRTMSNLLKDLLPDAPREKTVLVAAAEAGLAETLRDHVAQGVDTDTAIRLSASSFSAKTSFTPDACTWVASEFAVALGISEGGLAGAPIQVSPGPGYAPGPAPTQSAPGGPAPRFVPYQQAPVQSPPGPAQARGPALSPPGQVLSPPGVAQYPPRPGQPAVPGQYSPPGQPQYPPVPGQYPPGVAQYPPRPGQVGGPAPFSPGPPGPTGSPGPQQKNNSYAIAALVCGVAQFVLWFALVVPGALAAILALSFGIVSMRQIQRTGEGGRPMAIAGVVLGALGVLGGFIFFLVVIVAAVNSGSQ